jgi:hypothetical protein
MAETSPSMKPSPKKTARVAVAAGDTAAVVEVTAGVVGVDSRVDAVVAAVVVAAAVAAADTKPRKVHVR